MYQTGYTRGVNKALQQGKEGCEYLKKRIESGFGTHTVQVLDEDTQIRIILTNNKEESLDSNFIACSSLLRCVSDSAFGQSKLINHLLKLDYDLESEDVMEIVYSKEEI